MDTAMARRCKLEPRPSARTVKLADGSIKTATGTVTATCSLQQAEGRGTPLEFEAEFCVTELQGYDVIVGMPWLSHFNPAIDWSSGRLVVQRPGQGPAVLERYTTKEPDEHREPEIAAAQQFSCSAISYARMARAIRKGDIDLSSIELMRVQRAEDTTAQRHHRTVPNGLATADDTQPQDPQLSALAQEVCPSPAGRAAVGPAARTFDRAQDRTHQRRQAARSTASTLQPSGRRGDPQAGDEARGARPCPREHFAVGRDGAAR